MVQPSADGAQSGICLAVVGDRCAAWRESLYRGGRVAQTMRVEIAHDRTWKDRRWICVVRRHPDASLVCGTPCIEWCTRQASYIAPSCDIISTWSQYLRWPVMRLRRP